LIIGSIVPFQSSVDGGAMGIIGNGAGTAADGAAVGAAMGNGAIGAGAGTADAGIAGAGETICRGAV